MPLTALYPGSFDPFTNAHLGITERALSVFDRVIIGIARNSGKKAFFSIEDRVEMIRHVVRDEKRIQVCSFEGLTIEYAGKIGAQAIIRGLRAVADFEYELAMANMNRKINSDIETLFLMTSEEYFFVSSRNVKEVASFDGDISGLVPPYIADKMRNKFNKSEG